MSHASAVEPFGTGVDDDDRLAAVRRLVLRGEVREALDRLRALRPELATAPTAQQAVAVALTVTCHLAQGRLDSARTAAADLDRLDRLDGSFDSATTSVVDHTRGELAAAAGQSEAAVEHYLAAGRHAGPHPDPVVDWRTGAALAMLRTVRRREAHELALEQHRVALTHGTAHAVAAALRVLAATSPDASRVALLREARDLLAHSDALRLAAQVATDLAALLVLIGEETESLALLRQVETYAGRHELWLLQGRTRSLLERLGHGPRRVDAEALAVLTAGERRVTVLAVGGLTNRGIADELGISVKAVEGHLSRVYRKLGIRSRTALLATIGSPS